MKLSLKDRLILANQYRILEHVDTTGSNQYGLFAEILERGYTNLYSELTQTLWDDMDISISESVFEILNLYREIEGYKKANPQDTKVCNHASADLPGFDGNHEGEHRSFALFLVRQMGKYQEQVPIMKRTKLNSHTPMLGRYARMLTVWDRMGNKNSLSHDEVLAILNA